MIDPLILFRAVHIAATALASGTVAFIVLVAEPAAAAATADFSALRRRLTWTIWIALAVAVLAEAGWLVLLSADIYGAPVIAVCLHGGVWTVLTDTRFGLVCTVRLGLAVLLAVLVVVAGDPPAANRRRRRPDRPHRSHRPCRGDAWDRRRHPSCVRHGASAGGRRLARRPAGARHAAGAAPAVPTTRLGVASPRARRGGFPGSGSSASPRCWRAASSIAGTSWADRAT